MFYEIKPVNKLSLGLKELWEFKELFYFFTWRDIKVKYKQTVLGILWAILQPLLLMLVFTFFFAKGLGMPSNNIPYPIFVFSGLLLWNIFSSGLSSASQSMISNANIIKKIYFPRLIIPISSILVSLFDFTMALIVFIGILIFYKQPVQLNIIVFFPISIAITTMATFGLGAGLAALNIKYRDFRYIIPFLIQLLLFVTPVIYPLSIIRYKWIQVLLSLNPMMGAIELLRSSITFNPVDLQILITSTASSLLLLLLGLFYFKKTEHYFADIA